MEITDLVDFVPMLQNVWDEGMDRFNYGYNEYCAERIFFLWQANPRTINFVLLQRDRLVGFMAGITAPHNVNYWKWYYYEHMWYVMPEYRSGGGGIKLLNATEAECKIRGISHMIMGHQVHFMKDYFHRLFPRLGFKEAEHLWVKEV